MASTNDLKNGMVLDLDGQLWQVLWSQHHKPGKGNTVVRTKLKNVMSNKIVDRTFNSDTKVDTANVDRREMQYLYRDGDSFHFMNTANYEQLHIDIEVLGDNANYIVPESTILVEFYEEEPVGIELPVTVDLKVVDTVPGINRATASAQVKPATLETGLVVQVPPFVSVGDTLRISTETGEYLKKV